MTTAVVRSDKCYRTEVRIRNHTIIADELIQDGGTDAGPTPMEILLGMAGACISVTTRAYAQRHNWPLKSISVALDMVRFKSGDYPAYEGDAPYVTEISERIHFEGPLTDDQKARLLAVAGKCPVHITMENPVVFVEELLNNEVLDQPEMIGNA